MHHVQAHQRAQTPAPQVGGDLHRGKPEPAAAVAGLGERAAGDGHRPRPAVAVVEHQAAEGHAAVDVVAKQLQRPLRQRPAPEVVQRQPLLVRLVEDLGADARQRLGSGRLGQVVGRPRHDDDLRPDLPPLAGDELLGRPADAVGYGDAHRQPVAGVELADVVERHRRRARGRPDRQRGVGPLGDAVAGAQQPLARPSVLDAGKRLRGGGFHRADVGVAHDEVRQRLDHQHLVVREVDGFGRRPVRAAIAFRRRPHHQGVHRFDAADDVGDLLPRGGGLLRGQLAAHDDAAAHLDVAGAPPRCRQAGGVGILGKAHASSARPLSSEFGSSWPNGSSSTPGVHVMPPSVHPARLISFFARRFHRPVSTSV